MRTEREIKSDLLDKRQQDALLLSSQFSFCVGGNLLVYPVTREEYIQLARSGGIDKDSTLFGYHLGIQE